MPTRAATSLSIDRNAEVAASRASAEALAAVGGRADLALVFATVGYAQDVLLAAVRRVVGSDCAVAGCSGEGVIARGDSIEGDFAVAVMLVAFDGVRAQSLLAESYDTDPDGAASRIADRIGDARDVLGVLVFPDGLVGNCTTFLRRLEARLPGVTIAGGTAGDAMLFRRTYQYCDGRAFSGSASAVVLRGRGELKISVSHGCAPVGPQQTITDARGAWVHAIDGRPAWSVFKEYLDGDPKDLNAEGIVHLCIGTSADAGARGVSDPMIIHTPLALDEKTGALMFPGGGLHQGQRIRMTRRDPERIRETAAACAKEVVDWAAGRQPAFVLQFDCAGRGKVMFGACVGDEIVKPLRDQFDGSVSWAGFHTYGEIARIGKELHYHNYTVALCAYYDLAG